VPSMHRKRSSDGRRSRIHGRSSGGVHRQIQAFLSRESPVATAKRPISTVTLEKKNFE
jgi:hypothetical protein